MRIVREEVSKQVYCKLHDKLREQTKEQVRYQLSEHVSSEIYGIVNEQIFVGTILKIQEQISDQLKDYIVL